MNNPLDLKELLLGDPNRLRYVQRYSTSMVIHRENVAEHSYYVALYGRYLCRWLQTREDKMYAVNVQEVLERALYHDMDEARTGDFQRPFKYSSESLKQMLDKASEHEAYLVLLSPLPEDALFATRAVDLWKRAKDFSIEGRVIALADFMTVVSYLWQEAQYASPTLSLNYETLLEYVKTFDHESFEPLRPLIDELAEIVNTVAKQGIGK